MGKRKASVRVPSPRSAAGAAAASVLAREVDFRMHHTHVSGQSVAPAESLLFHAKGTSDLLLADVVDGILVTG